MIKVEFSPEIIERLEYERYHHPSPLVQRKMEVLYLKSRGLSHQEIRRICGISKTTMAEYLKQYRDGGMERLKELRYKGKSNALLEHRTTLEDHLRERKPRTTAEARAIIEEVTGIRRSPTQIRAFMKRIGMK